MATKRSTAPAVLSSGYVFVLLGLLTFVCSRLVDSGFFHGFFQGATVALMVFGAYLLGRRYWWAREDPDDGGMWLPSENGRDAR